MSATKQAKEVSQNDAEPIHHTFEDAIAEKFPDPHIERIEFEDGTVVEAKSHTYAAMQWWEAHPNTLPPYEHALAAGVTLFTQTLYWGGWLLGSAYLEGTKPDYRYHGLNSLGDLYAKTLKGHLKGKLTKLQECYSAETHPNSDPAEKTCVFDDWLKGFSLSLQDFSVDTPEDLHPTLHDAVCRFVNDIRFHEKSLEVRKRPQTKLRPILRNFALAWDASPIPLRFFTDEAALEYCLDQLGYGNKHLGDYRKTFRRGGKGSREGLANLETEDPAIITQWDCEIVKVQASAAKSHGFNPFEASEILELVTNRRIVVARGSG